MADVSICMNDTCKCVDCYRKTAEPNEDWQSYCYFGQKDCDKCTHYIKKVE